MGPWCNGRDAVHDRNPWPRVLPTACVCLTTHLFVGGVWSGRVAGDTEEAVAGTPIGLLYVLL